ncbi:MAG TPA: UDP-N-acetylmuramoyl-L-alanine--D-glutamate ligase [Ottowia sp.]|uniref:UDP-N-acetylmuramoyl-L-alanine--D-glutamate ligase n=1 Tax=Ottowia sp. TaxID=1898956 RepID=UPI002BC69311|nr:UDP-N-acetylmuramoyl-L-alanine--D-glutamate ligase [Ottowia sp.]HMN21263.1 UDP-N-acetylmuramoyl-L-alanine--D-glutamate ligase [Ottowia sp.]
MNTLQGLHVLVLGLGASGLAMARWCARAGARVTVADTRAEPPQLAALRAAVPGAAFVSGPFTASLAADPSLRAVYRSPGLAPAEIAAVTEAAAARALPVAGELDLFTQALSQLKAERGYAPAVLAVTGTNGKTTVTALAGQLIERAGKSVAVAGNIGPSLLDTLAARLDAGELPEAWVLELSSFQLDAAHDFEPTAAVLLNITQDHLDWHGSLEAYAAAKAKVFGPTGAMVLNRDDARVAALRPAPAKAVRGQRPLLREVISFGTDLPPEAGDFGLESVAGMTWLVRALPDSEPERRRKAGDAPELHLQRLMPADALRIRGRHNAANALAALALAVACGCPLAPMLYGLREYRGEPHRLQSVGVLGGIEFFDDSKGTNVGATVAALQGLGGERSAGPSEASESPLGGQGGHQVPDVGAIVQRRVVLILGGQGKGQDFAPLADPVARHARAVILIGQDAPLIRQVLSGVPLLDAADMAQAVVLARDAAQAGDAVLLSPACASFDMFDNYGHRGDVFRAEVQALAHAEGIELEALA